MTCPCGATVTATGFCQSCGSAQRLAVCRHCQREMIAGTRFCGHCGKPVELEEIYVELVNADDLVVDRFVDSQGVEREQQVRSRTVIDGEGIRQVPLATKVWRTPGVEVAISDGRLTITEPDVASGKRPVHESTPEPQPASMTWFEFVNALARSDGLHQKYHGLLGANGLGKRLFEERR